MKTATLIFVIALQLGLETVAGSEPSQTVRQLQFSPDGRYLLAQDDSGIIVLTIEPLRILFRIPAANATLGHFTPDSNEIVVAVSMTLVDWRQIRLAKDSPRVERWSVRDQRRVTSSPIPKMTCGPTRLAPDGLTLACLDLRGTLHAVDVVSGREVLKRRNFRRSTVDMDSQSNTALDGPLVIEGAVIEFSPDGRFLIGASDNGVIWDARELRDVKAGGQVKRISSGYVGYVTFLSAGQVVVPQYLNYGGRWEPAAQVLTFPSGDLLFTQPIICYPGPNRHFAQSAFRRAADPGFVIIRYQHMIDPGGIGGRSPCRMLVETREAALSVVALELSTGLMILSDSTVLDIFGNRHVTEVRPGVVGLWKRGEGLIATVELNEK